MGVIVNLEQKHVDRSERYQQAVERKLKSTPNYTGLSAKDRWKVGYLGECALSLYLEQRNVDHEWRRVADGESQISEITIGDALVEVKTASEAFHKWVLVPETQPCDFSYIVGVKRHTDKRIELMGYLSAQKWKEIAQIKQVQIRSYCCGFNQLWPIEQLADRFLYVENRGIQCR